MKKSTIKLWLSLVLAIFISVGVSSIFVSANSNELEVLRYNVQLDRDGSGRIIETREMVIEEGTENFIELEGLNPEDILEFTVIANGSEMTWNENWDSNASQEEKANEYGILETNNGIELVWGIPDYGYINYELRYTINHMVYQLDDGQAMNWRFFAGDDSLMPERMTLNLQTPREMNADNTTIALLGLEGAEWELSDGNYRAEKTSSMSDGEDIILLLQFHEQMFGDLERLNLTKDEQLDEALDGSTYIEDTGQVGTSHHTTTYSRPGFPWYFSIPNLIYRVVRILIFVIPAFMLGRLGYSLGKPKLIENFEYKYGHMDTINAGIRRNKDSYSSQIPFDGEISDIAFLLDELDAGKFEDYFFAYLLKWAKEEKILMVEEEVGKIRKKEMMIIHVQGTVDNHATEIEKDFWSLIEGAKRSDGSIQEGDLSSYSQRQYRMLANLEKELLEDSKKWLIENQYIIEEEKEFLHLFKRPVNHLTDEGEKLLDRIVQFENFLQEIDEQTATQEDIDSIENWEDFLIWSCLLGYSQRTVEGLEGHFPEVWENTVYMYPYYGHYDHFYIYRTRMDQGYRRGGSSSYGSNSGSFSSGSSGGSFGGGGGGSMGGGSSGVR